MSQSIPEFALKPDEYVIRLGNKIPAFYIRVCREDATGTMILIHGGESGSGVHLRHEPLEIIDRDFYVFVSHDENLNQSYVRLAVLDFLVKGGEHVSLA